MNKKITQAILLILAAGGLTAQEKYIAIHRTEKSGLELLSKIPNVEAESSAQTLHISLNQYFQSSENSESIIAYSIIHNSHEEVAEVAISSSDLIIDFKSPGQTNVIINAEENGTNVSDTIAIGVRPVIEGGYDIATFENLIDTENSYWNGSDESGGFSSGKFYFHNDYNPDWFSWSGWAYSNQTDHSTPGWMNQYSAMIWTEENSNTYALSYASPSSRISFADSLKRVVKGFFITNSTYAALTMHHGDPYSKKFGGESGEDEDWFKLSIEGHLGESSTGIIDYLLADYTFQDSKDDYYIQTWQWIDLETLGEVDALSFSLSSTDNGDFGMNTPAFFCMDNLYASFPLTAEKFNVSKFRIYPNPSDGLFRIYNDDGETMSIYIYDLMGKVVYRNDKIDSGDLINIRKHSGGTYILKTKIKNEIQVKRILIN
jgi:hypothetical protein